MLLPAGVVEDARPQVLGISALPPEVRDLLLGYLTPATARPLACASRLWREQVVHCGAVWRGRLEARFPLTAARLQRAEARLREAQGGYLAYHEGTNYADAMKALPRLNQMAYGRVISHPDSEVTSHSDISIGVIARLSKGFSAWARSYWRPFPAEEMNILVVGLVRAGGSTALHSMRIGDVVTCSPAAGIVVETAAYKGLRATCFEVGGSCSERHLLRHYFQGTDGVIFVVDANDRDRFVTAEEGLGRFLSEPELQQYQPLLVFANKQDLPGAATPEEIAMRLRRPLQLVEATGAAEPSSRPWCVQGCSAVHGAGLADGFDWLVAACRAAGSARR